MNTAMTLEEVKNWFLSRQSMSPKKLQKMLYYAYSWGLVLLNDDNESFDNKLFDANFEAWVHGPVIPDIYFEYKPYGFQNIPQLDSISPNPEDDDVTDVLEQVLSVYGGFNGNQLESLTHSEEPWKNARKGLLPMDSSSNVIDDRIIYNYYFEQLGE